MAGSLSIRWLVRKGKIKARPGNNCSIRQPVGGRFVRRPVCLTPNYALLARAARQCSCPQHVENPREKESVFGRCARATS